MRHEHKLGARDSSERSRDHLGASAAPRAVDFARQRVANYSTHVPSKFRRNSNKTNDWVPHQVTHKTGCHSRLVGRGGTRPERGRGNPAISRAVALLPCCRRLSRRSKTAASPGIAPWRLAGGARSAEREISANRYALSRDPFDVAAKAATYKTKNPAEIASQNSQIKCHTMQSLLRLISLKTNDRHPNKVSHFSESRHLLHRGEREFLRLREARGGPAFQFGHAVLYEAGDVALDFVVRHAGRHVAQLRGLQGPHANGSCTGVVGQTTSQAPQPVHLSLTSG